MRRQTITQKHFRLSWLSCLLLFPFLWCSATAFAAPSITATPNPVHVPYGQTQAKTTIAWNTDGAGGFVWLSVDGGEESAVAADVAKGSLELSVTLGKTYEIKLYSAGKERVLASVKVSVIAQPSSVGGPLKNPKNQSNDDFNLKRTDQGILLSQTPRELRCRGSAALEINESANHFLYFTFVRARLPVDPAGRNLSPGQCGWTERPMRDDDQESLFQATDKTTGDVYRSNATVSNRERFPNYDEVRRALMDPNRYWSFFVRATGREHMFSEYSRQWIPIKSSSIQKVPRITRP